jgi:cytochrome c-type biogenesis protein CcmH
MLWFIFLVMTVAAIAALTMPLMRDHAAPGDATSASLALYVDQLAEVDADEARGIIGPVEAKAARTEIERRILALKAAPSTGPATQKAPKLAALLLAAFVTLSAGGVYLGIGAPQAVGRKATIAADDPMHAQMNGLIEQLAQKLKQDPNNPEGWALLARSLVRIDRYDKAVEAYAQARALIGDGDAQLNAEYAEARVIASGGLVDRESKRLFEVLLLADKKDPQARYYLALARGQGGDLPGALKEWKALLSDTAPDAPWRETLVRQIAKAEGREAAPPSAPRGPSAADMQAASKMSDADRQAMIEGMVASLAARLQTDRNDVEGWRQLARAYEVLGRTDEAVKAHREVLRIDPSDAGAKAALAR